MASFVGVFTGRGASGANLGVAISTGAPPGIKSDGIFFPSLARKYSPLSNHFRPRLLSCGGTNGGTEIR